MSRFSLSDDACLRCGRVDIRLGEEALSDDGFCNDCAGEDFVSAANSHCRACGRKIVSISGVRRSISASGICEGIDIPECVDITTRRFRRTKSMPNGKPLTAAESAELWRKAGRNPITPASQLTQEAQERQMAGYAPDWAQTTAEALGYY